MSAAAILPTYSQAVVGSNGLATPAFYRFFAALGNVASQSSGLQSQIDAINQEIDGFGGGFQVRGVESIVQSGASVPGGVMMLSLMGDVETAGNTQYYGSDQSGNKGWYAVASALSGSANVDLTTASNGVTTFDLSKPGNSSAGTIQAVTVDAFGRVTGTRAATITGTANQIDVANGDGSAGPPTLSLDATVINQLAALVGSPGLGYIDGLKMVWNSATSLSVTSGAAYIPSPGHVLQSPAMLTLSSLVLTASTWYHVYLYNNAGTPAVECVTTAPDAPYNGTARTKTGDTSRRYIGSILTNASSQIIRISHNISRGLVLYEQSVVAAPFLVLVGTATTPTSVSCAGVVPVTSINALVTTTNNDTTAVAIVGNSNIPPSGTGPMWLDQSKPTGTETFELLLDNSLSFQYMFTSSATGSFVVRVKGYFYER